MSAEERIYTHLEETVAIEEDFKAQQKEITDLEKQEQEIYSQIIEMDIEEMDGIIKLSEEAAALIDERKEKLEIEKNSLESAKDEFQSVEALIEDLEEEALKEKAKELYEVMMDRYASYDELYEAYTQSLELEKELYTLLQEEELEQETLNKQIVQINDSYEKILSFNEDFNKYTTQYNELKKEFYEAAEMNVTFEKEE